MGQNNIIEINGKQYDAVTGALLGESRIKATPIKRTNAARHGGRAIDGFIRKQPFQAPTVIKPTPLAAHKTASTVKPVQKATPAKKIDIQRAVPKHAKAHTPERPKTLMRHVVKKPQASLKPAIKTAGPTEMMAKPTSTLAKPLEKKLSVANVDPVRMSRAKHVAKSHHVRRFNPSRAEQQALAAQAAQRKKYATARPVHQDMRPVAVATQKPHVSQSVALKQAAPHAQHQQPKKQTANDIFEAALAHANSHQEPLQQNKGKRAVRKRRAVSAIAGLATFLVIIGFVTYLNKPAIELRFASIQAGFHASMPDYKSTGYALEGGVKGEDGKVEMTFRSGANSYKVTQVASDWNSATLLDQNTDQRGTPTRTIQSQGRIIYIYNKDASWVDSGVRYEIQGNADLSTDDIVTLATSM